jgi:carbon monoxide dehydrogenase subunit G
MEVSLTKQYPLAVQADQAWTVLRDLKAVASCMPGAELTEQVDDRSYKGTVKVKVGPASALFGGLVEVLEVDEVNKRMSLRGKGADKGGSSASMDLVATIEATPDGKSQLLGDAKVIVNGKFAQFGGRMMVQVSDVILAQFVENFRASAANVSTDSELAAASLDEASVTPAAPARQTELNGLAILWSLIKGWFRGLLGGGSNKP